MWANNCVFSLFCRRGVSHHLFLTWRDLAVALKLNW